MAQTVDNWGAAERALNIPRATWIKLFAGVGSTNHTELAKASIAYLEAEHAKDPAGILADTNLHWWGQAVAIAYEHEIGARVPGERCDGSFAASATKTLNGTMDDVYAAWCDFAANLVGVAGVPFAGDARRSETPKWRYWRINLDNGAAVSVNITQKPPSASGVQKVALAAEVTKLNSVEQVDYWKAEWKELLASFAAVYSADK